MGCSSSKTVLSQVSEPAHVPVGGESPKAKTVTGVGRAPDQGPHKAEWHGDIAQPPGVVPTAANSGAVEVQVLPTEHVSPTNLQSVCTGWAASTAAPATAELVPEEPTLPPSSAAPQAPFRLFPIQSSEDDIFSVFSTYGPRIPADMAKTLDTSWENLVAEKNKAGIGPGASLEWYWLATSDERACASSADGLVVFRLAQGLSSSHGQICHLSLSSSAWMCCLPAAIAAVRNELFTNLPVSLMRITLWYATDEEGKLAFDKRVETVFKEAGFRWFQLNNANGKRGQVMMLRRAAGIDPPTPEEVVDLRFSSCLFLSYGVEALPQQTEELERCDENDALGTCGVSGNHLVMAECLRRHALSKPDGAQQEAQRAKESIEGGSEEEHCDNDASASNLRRALDRRGTLDLVRSSDTADIGECEDFARECLRGIACCPSADSKPCAQLALFPSQPQDGSTTGQRVFCGGLVLGVNWKEEPISDSLNPFRLRVPVYATGRAPGEEKPLVVYLATEDDDVFITVWLLPQEHKHLLHRGLHHHCQQVVREAPPAAVEDARAVTEVSLPRFYINAPALADVPKFSGEHYVQRPTELLGAKLSSRPAQRGALQRALPAQAAMSLRVDSPFLICAWHTRLDDLEVPLYAVVVSPKDWVGGGQEQGQGA